MGGQPLEASAKKGRAPEVGNEKSKLEWLVRALSFDKKVELLKQLVEQNQISPEKQIEIDKLWLAMQVLATRVSLYLELSSLPNPKSELTRLFDLRKVETAKSDGGRSFHPQELLAKVYFSEFIPAYNLVLQGVPAKDVLRDCPLLRFNLEDAKVEISAGTDQSSLSATRLQFVKYLRRVGRFGEMARNVEDHFGIHLDALSSNPRYLRNERRSELRAEAVSLAKKRLADESQRSSSMSEAESAGRLELYTDAIEKLLKRREMTKVFSPRGVLQTDSLKGEPKTVNAKLLEKFSEFDRQMWEEYDQCLNPRNKPFQLSDLAKERLTLESLFAIPFVLVPAFASGRLGWAAATRLLFSNEAMDLSILELATNTTLRLGKEFPLWSFIRGKSVQLTGDAAIDMGKRAVTRSAGGLSAAVAAETASLGLEGQTLFSVDDSGERLAWNIAFFTAFGVNQRIMRSVLFERYSLEKGLFSMTLSKSGELIARIPDPIVSAMIPRFAVGVPLQTATILGLSGLQEFVKEGRITVHSERTLDKVFLAVVQAGLLEMTDGAIRVGGSVRRRTRMMNDHPVAEQLRFVLNQMELAKVGEVPFVQINPSLRTTLSKIGQKGPIAVVGCSDSRVLKPQGGPGEIFAQLNAGNVVHEPTVAYSSEALGSKLTIVIAHSRCGAVEHAMPYTNSGKHTLPGEGGTGLHNYLKRDVASSIDAGSRHGFDPGEFNRFGSMNGIRSERIAAEISHALEQGRIVGTIIKPGQNVAVILVDIASGARYLLATDVPGFDAPFRLPPRPPIAPVASH